MAKYYYLSVLIIGAMLIVFFQFQHQKDIESDQTISIAELRAQMTPEQLAAELTAERQAALPYLLAAYQKLEKIKTTHQPALAVEFAAAAKVYDQPANVTAAFNELKAIAQACQEPEKANAGTLPDDVTSFLACKACGGRGMIGSAKQALSGGLSKDLQHTSHLASKCSSCNGTGKSKIRAFREASATSCLIKRLIVIEKWVKAVQKEFAAN